MTRMTKPLRKPLWIDWAERVASPNQSGRMYSPEGIVIHWTASPNSGDAESDRARVERWLEGKGGKSSTHFVILRDGTLIQAVPIGRRAWHAGKSTLQLGNGQRLARCNEHCIGVDFENCGPLTHKGRGKYVDWAKRPYHGPKPEEKHEPYTEAQIETACKLFSELGALFPNLQDDVGHRVIGHHDVRATKPDPGPLCPWDVLRDAICQRVSE